MTPNSVLVSAIALFGTGWIDREQNLLIHRLDGKASPWKTDPGDLSNAAIESWGFADHGAAIVVHWVGRRDLRNFFKSDLASGGVTARMQHPQS
jgi:hypothetical protein